MIKKKKHTIEKYKGKELNYSQTIEKPMEYMYVYRFPQ